MTAGFSLGEYSALTFAGVMELDTALTLLKVRGDAMGEACDLTPSGMMTVVGLDDDLVGVVGTTVTTATASDVDTTGSLSWAIVGGADAGRFTIDATTGVLSFAQTTDHEAPLDVGGDNVYTVRIQVSDGVQTSWQDLLVTVRDLNDNAPVITSHSGAASATVHHAENTQAFATMAATDADASSTLVWRISGGIDIWRPTQARVVDADRVHLFANERFLFCSLI